MTFVFTCDILYIHEIGTYIYSHFGSYIIDCTSGEILYTPFFSTHTFTKRNITQYSNIILPSSNKSWSTLFDRYLNSIPIVNKKNKIDINKLAPLQLAVIYIYI